MQLTATYCNTLQHTATHCNNANRYRIYFSVTGKLCHRTCPIPGLCVCVFVRIRVCVCVNVCECVSQSCSVPNYRSLPVFVFLSLSLSRSLSHSLSHSLSLTLSLALFLALSLSIYTSLCLSFSPSLSPSPSLSGNLDPPLSLPSLSRIFIFICGSCDVLQDKVKAMIESFGGKVTSSISGTIS